MLDKQKLENVKNAISVISSEVGVAYCHFVEYDFQTSLETPRIKSVNYDIYAPKTYDDAKRIWMEGLASLKEYDNFQGTDLFYKNFTEELYFSGSNRISLCINGALDITASRPITIDVKRLHTPSNYEYYEIHLKVSKLISATYSIKTGVGKLSGQHQKFMAEVKNDLKKMPRILAFEKNDFENFDDEINEKFANHPDLLNAKDAIKMAILFTWPTTKNKIKYYAALIPPAFEICNEHGIKQITAGGIALFSNNSLTLSLSLFDCLQNWASIHTTKQLLNYSKSEAIKSAIAAIMSRNMSHNLGSHYLYYTKSYLEQKAADDGDVAPDIRGVAKVLGYLQSRMDFLATIISNDKYSYGPVNFKSQIFDELTVDDFSHRHFPEETNKRTTNFLLTNLIRSENFTRDDVKTDDENLRHENRLFLKVKYSNDGVVYRDFTGSWHENIISQEQGIKNDLSRLNLALPGGIMSSHAFFTVLENFIRNSAKNLREDVSEKDGLVFTIVIRPYSEPKKNHLDIIFYDNKRNANKYSDDNGCKTLFLDLCERLGRLEVIDKSNVLAKEDKGLKEMLLSTIWMRAYMFGENESFSDILTRINNEEDSMKKLDLIEYYGFKFVKVVEGEGVTGFRIYDRNNRIKHVESNSNLGLLFTLPIYQTCQQIKLTNDSSTNEHEMFNVMADVVEVKKTEQFIDVMCPDLRKVFTRVIEYDCGKKKSDLEKFRRAIKERFPDIDKYAICFMRDGEPPLCEPLYKSYLEEGVMGDNSNIQYRIYFKYHLDSKEKPGKKNKGLAYVDTVSGGNFTITLEELFKNAVKNGFNRDDHFKEEADELLALKIKESALTRITIIDERLFKTTKVKKNALEWLSLKNIRLLNFDENSDSTLGANEAALSRVFVGNSFNNYSNETHFLTIHLGLIEKILKNSRIVNAYINNLLNLDADQMLENKLSKDRIEVFMGMLKEYFGEDAFIAVHSGRGNSLSKDMNEALRLYPFVSLSALENAFNNSKFQLSQLLYNTIYMRKKS